MATTSLEGLLRNQDELSGRIVRFLTNTLKVGQEKLTLPMLRQRKALLASYWREFSEQHRAIIRLADKTCGYLANDVFDHIEGCYLDHLVEFDERIQKLEPDAQHSEKRSAKEPTTNTATTWEPTLPKIALPTFAGEILKWESFRDQFRALVHDSEKLSNVQRLRYLKTCLTGEAATMLELTPVTDANYAGAWEALCRRFGNRRVLSATHMRRLIDTAPITKPSPAEIKRILDESRQTQKAFEALGKPVREWDEWFLFLLSEKLDEETSMAWETSLTDPTNTPKFEELEKFLEARAHAMVVARARESAQTSKSSKGKTTTPANKSVLTVKIADRQGGAKVKSGKRCSLCSGNHALSACRNFKELPAVDRRDLVLKKGLCLSCLASGHLAKQCTSKFRCWVCEGLHHTTLHDVCQKDEDPATSMQPTTASYTVSAHKVTLLATATVVLEAPGGRTLAVRALLDPGSESSFLSEWAAQTLKLRRRTVRVNLTGYQGMHVGTAQAEVEVTLRSQADGDFHLVLEALVTKTLTAPTPSRPISTGDWPHLSGLPLADSHFSRPAKVDVLLGADVCGLLMLEQRTGPPGTPVAIRTPFGWTLIGPVVPTGPTRHARVLHVSRHEPQPDLQRFWELEEVPNSSPMTPEELRCEELFTNTTRRDPSGRYVVRLPFLGEERPSTGRSRRAALQLLLNAERKRGREPDLHEQYREFIEEYRRLGHMIPATEILEEQDPGLYLPHHAVWKQDGTKKKIRVVFNAAAATSYGHSLNDALLPGPKLQTDLWVVVTRWRLFRIAFSADIVKMFRQILVHPDDQEWLRILWRDDPAMSVGDYKLTTVTYGTAPAPYLAHRVLHQLAVDEAHRFPLGAKTLCSHSYVDDILAGADDIEGAKEVRQQLVGILRSAGFQLDKWASMTMGIRTEEDSKTFGEGDVHGALGLQWDTRRDSLSVRDPRTIEVRFVAVWTKRAVLSEVAKLFDPLGWLAPVIIRAKVLVQDLWLANVTWDEPIEPLLARRWNDLRKEITRLNEISLPRWVHYSPERCEVEFHGFCDASERAYAAAVYMLVRRSEITKVSLLMAKTRVAPTRKVVSIPRLELCSAVLLARLLSAMQEALSIPHASEYAWTDSTVALAWIQAHPSKWKPFVAHRVAEIQSLLPGVKWRHVGTRDNPADLPSRGISGDDLQQARLWWEGPAWLSEPGSNWPISSTTISKESTTGEERHVSIGIVQEANSTSCLVLERFSTLTRLIRVSAYLRRFLNNCRRAGTRRIGPLTTVELREALHMVTRICQAHSFPDEFAALRRGKVVPLSSSLKLLSPVIGDDGLLRVGGRLQNSILPEFRRSPAIIDRTSHLATLVIRDAHQKTLHGGLNATLSWIHRVFWIPRCRPQIKQILRDCVTCTRMRGSTGRQQMGPLPSARVQPARPFLRSGVDYAGPVQLRTNKGRGHKSQKGYIVVFVCLATKAVHLDAVSDLTSEAFLAAFHRFTARRGRCSHLLSDNGTTFRGADVLLRKLFTASSRFFTEVVEALANDGTEWSFIPPYSPHMGGLWEAAVKSMKMHLRRVIGESTLTFEEMTTLLCRIEACLNSRPLIPLPDDPNDQPPLTPGHFLIGESLRTAPDPPPDDVTVPLTKRWRLLSNMTAHFWRRWSREYLHQLQQRTKWPDRQRNLSPGTIVLLKDDLSPPTRWPMARVESTHPGKDGLVRVATLRVGSRTFRRAIAKVVVLPVHESAAGTA